MAIHPKSLAREWAIKVLYQQELGRSEPAETLNSAMERVRMEFVQRGSRVASGSTLEFHTLDTLTAYLQKHLVGLSAESESALLALLSQAVRGMVYWQEIAFEVALKKKFRTNLPNFERMYAPFALNEAMEAVPEDQPHLKPIAEWCVHSFPEAMKEELQKLAVQTVVGLAKEAPLMTGLYAHLDAGRNLFFEGAKRDWERIVKLATTHIRDWIRVAGFTHQLINGVWTQKEVLDNALKEAVEGWSMERQAVVDKNILRMGVYELLFCPETPINVLINEAVELAKKYSTAESGRFVNGTLAGVAQRATLPPRSELPVTDEEATLDTEIEIEEPSE